MEDQSIPALVSTGGEQTTGESSGLAAGCREGWSFPRTSARDAGQGALWSYTPALVRQDGFSASPEQCSSPKLQVLLPFPEHLSLQKPPRNLAVPHSGRRATGTSHQSRPSEESRRDWHQAKSKADSHKMPWDATQTSRTGTRLQRHCLRGRLGVRWGLAECKAA